MFKAAKVSLVVESVERAVKFYTEKLLFTIIDMIVESEGGSHISYAELRRGKFNLIVRAPAVDELAEFSMVRRCSGRATGAVLEVKADISKFFETCKKKKITIISNLREIRPGVEAFQAKDPFGFKLTFIQVNKKEALASKTTFFGLPITSLPKIKSDSDVPESMVTHMRSLGLSRRAAKKFIKQWVKR